MAVVTTKSGAITNRDATPRVINNGAVAAGMVKGFVGKCAIASGDSTGSKLIFGSVPSNAVMKDLHLWAPDIGTTTAADIGLYKNTADGGAVVDADFFASAQSLSSGAVSALSVLHESGVLSLANAEKPLWEALGLSEDPCLTYDIVATLTGDADAAGDVVLKAEYMV